MAALAQWAKRSRFAARLARGSLQVHVRRIPHYLLRGHLIRARRVRRYIRSTEEPRIQLGCGPHPLAGWLNSDLLMGDIYLDVTRPFPLPDSSFAFVHSEHVIEHIPEEAGRQMLREIHRVLRPGGVVRITTPDLGKLVALYEDRSPVVSRADYARYLEEGTYGIPHPRASQVLNTAMRAWGHQFIYDEEDLVAKLSESGFVEVERVDPGESPHPLLAGLERHGSEWSNAAEAMTLEATRA
ncbi:MAG: class I SAM-dependent methyltransferase [Solirubrobacterales bacterium]